MLAVIYTVAPNVLVKYYIVINEDSFKNLVIIFQFILIYCNLLNRDLVLIIFFISCRQVFQYKLFCVKIIFHNYFLVSKIYNKEAWEETCTLLIDFADLYITVYVTHKIKKHYRLGDLNSQPRRE